MSTEGVGLLIRGLERLSIDACIPLLVFIGYRLFARGIDGSAEIEVDAKTISGKIKNASPGVVCLLGAIALGTFVFRTPFEYEQTHSIEHPPVEQPPLATTSPTTGRARRERARQSKSASTFRWSSRTHSVT